MSACPPTEALGRLGGDSLDPEGFARLEGHIEHCPACHDRLERLARHDPSEAAAVPMRSRPAEIPGYRIGPEIGRGGSGVVHEATQLPVGRAVALKIVAGGPALGPEERERWLREARALGRLRHPNILRLHDAGEHAGWLYLVLDLVPGGSLADRLGGPLEPAVAARLLERVARAAEAIHRAGLLHLDIKPSNILLDGPPGAPLAGSDPLLADFGIAREAAEIAASATMTGALGPRGTPAYMAPEQAAGPRRAIGPAADIFALGATLYTLLTGRPPFQGATAIETLDLLRSREPARPRDLVPHLPRDLETICLACLRKEPGRRYATAGDLADDLGRWLEGFPIRVRPTTRTEHAWRWCRRHPATAALAGLLGLSTLAGLLGLAALWRHSEDQRGRAGVALARSRASEAAAEEATRHLIELIGTGVEDPHRPLGDRLGEVLPVLFELTAGLRRDAALAAAHAPAVARLEIRLAHIHWTRSDLDRALALVNDAIGLLDAARAARPGAAGPAIALADALMKRAELVSQTQQDAAASDCRRARECLAPHALDPRAFRSLVIAQDMHHAIALDLIAGADPAAGRRLLAENRALHDRLARARPGDPDLALLAALCRLDEVPGAPGATREVAAEALRGPGPGVDLHPNLALILGDRIARELFDAHVVSARPGLAAERAAEEVAGALEEWSEGLSVGPELRFAIVHQLGERGAVRTTRARHADRPDEARWGIDWLAALGRAILLRDPGDAGAHVVLSLAALQDFRQAQHLRHDPRTQRIHLREALAEAATALSLKPGDEWTRQRVALLQERYLALVAPGEPGGAGP